jgi:hypothetical protein
MKLNSKEGWGEGGKNEIQRLVFKNRPLRKIILNGKIVQS